MKKYTVRDIISKVFSEGYIDDHDHNNVIHQIDDVVIHVRGLNFEEAEVCPHFPNTHYSVNPFYIDDEDGYVHLAMGSIGGVVRNGDIDQYNREMNLNELAEEEHYCAFHIISMLHHVKKEAWEKKYAEYDVPGYKIA